MVDRYTPENFHPRASVGALIGRVRGALFSTMDEALAQFDLTTPQYVALVMIANGTATRPGDISKKIQHDPGAMTRLIDKLEQHGLVRRVSDPNDRRALNLELTAHGKALYPKVIKVTMDVMNRSLSGFTQAEAQQLEDMLQRMIANVEQRDTQ
ncbi:MAG: MarR family transcriptional regulator [Gallionellaceae bacterium]|jgi:DNA-binding MarR family transcriptional regulator|nr:MarR family transcriptional regulator [Gallionellaceae bacterium]